MTVHVPALIVCIALATCVSPKVLGAKPSPPQSATSKQEATPADQLPLAAEVPCSEAPQPVFPYRVNLTPQQERRAKGLYRRSLVITAHDHCFHAGDFEDMKAGGITVRTIKLTTDGIYWQRMKRYPIESEVAGWQHRGRMAIEILDSEVAASKGKIVVVRKVDDIFAAKRKGKLGIILSFEGARPLEGKIQNLQTFYNLGLRDMQLVWAVPSPLKTSGGRLTPFGEEVIREMNRLGMVIDLSHMTQAGFDQALVITQRPIVISHCAVAAVTGAGRGGGTDQLTDEGVRAIAKNGGAICLHFYEGYIRPHHGSRSTVEDLVDNMNYIKKLVGVNYIALGTDYFPEKGYPWIRGSETMRDMPNVAREMVRRGYTDDEIQKVLGLNLVRVYRRVWQAP